ncbi:hypothetical protein DPMN_043913 [Dreissena polymorpha]|uniref:Uncharacterized protein n=1 Tax=Dreissena polymorpha TaxID=45954 RepID=A0A9D4D3K6_DREPO|nr:hypothetical protein DPMN_043913 [Dreissena polymorpha]
MSAPEFPEPEVHLASSPNLPLIYAIFPDRIRQIHVDGVILKKSGFIKSPGECRAMVVNIFDGKAVALKMPEGYGQVTLLTPGGNLQMEIFENDNEEALFIQPEALVVTRKLVIVVADIAQQAVKGVTPESEVVFTYRGIRSPTALMCDEQNFIYIAGPNNVHQLTENRELVKFF